jgi:hypothetical protein
MLWAGQYRDRILAGGDEIFCREGPPSLLYNEYWVSFLAVKWPEHGIDKPLTSSTKVKERELYLNTPLGIHDLL